MVPLDGDLVAVIIRYMSGWTLQQKLVNMRHADCTVDNKQLNSILMQTFNNLGVSFIFIRYYSILLSSLFIYLFIYLNRLILRHCLVPFVTPPQSMCAPWVS
jgi:hypothetical protein